MSAGTKRLLGFAVLPLLLLAIVVGGRMAYESWRLDRLERRLLDARSHDDVARAAIAVLDSGGPRGSAFLVKYADVDPHVAFDAEHGILVRSDPKSGEILTVTSTQAPETPGADPALAAALADVMPRTWGKTSYDKPPRRYSGAHYAGMDGDWAWFAFKERDEERFLAIAFKFENGRIAVESTYELEGDRLERMRTSPGWPAAWR